MQTQSQEVASKFDTPLLAAAVLLLLGGVFAYYYLDGTLVFGLRLALIAGAVVLALGVGFLTDLGKRTWAMIVGSRVEVRKVVWPNRQQSIQLTLMVSVVVILTALFMWAADSFLLFAVKHITGGGA
ncbi:MAG: preprotein translocase subunit SecE [Pandoraea sp.]|uniref:preprotein translocase subunit SecE n=1 Tax=Pandoraea sp. TaxID=1883445 RepID=UPI0012283CBA|nr:preprotein translocase subunit SecE [Pandoraea sp.]TAM13329.1 MAG: preprotein translocase subunit SecE [Pandoraea sp.]